MFSTYDGAKRQAKHLNKTLFECSIIFPLNKCQTALAHAQGFSSWHDLRSSIDATPRVIDPAIFKRRLLNFLPVPCRRPADYWVDRRSYEWADQDTEISLEFRNWYHLVNPYLMSLMAGFNRKPPLLQPGSGKGQRLRKSIVDSALHGGMMFYQESGCFKLNPITLSVQKTASFYEFFADCYQHKDFNREFRGVVDAGILKWTQDNEDVGTIEIIPPSAEDLLKHVLECQRRRREYDEMVAVISKH